MRDVGSGAAVPTRDATDDTIAPTDDEARERVRRLTLGTEGATNERTS
jgi:hypothetical protein